MSRFLTAAMLGLLLLLPGGASAQDTVVKEPASGYEFPVELAVLDGKSKHALAGVGIRTKTFLAIKVYAMGLYVDAGPAGEALAKWNGKSAKQLADDDDFYGKLLEEGFGRTMRLVLARDIDGEDMGDAFDDALKPRVKALSKKGVKGSLADLEAFRAYFSLDELKKGTELTFTWESGGKLTSAMNRQQLGYIESPALAQALFDVYLGDDPIEDDAKKTLIARMPGIIKAAAAAKKTETPK